MYKVTASAVILTALTGCSQSGGIPSNQWSFKVPTGNEAADAQVEVDKANSGDASSAKSKLSADAQLANGKSVNSPVMGPAFEQPAADSSSVPKGSIAGRSSNQQTSGLSAVTYSPAGGLTSNLSNIRAHTRPDPVAQVRAYLRSGIPSALTNREPYNSQVYLSPLPVPQPASAPSKPSTGSSLGTEPAELSIPQSPSISAFFPGDAAPDYLSLGLPAEATGSVSPASDFSSNLALTESGSVGAFVSPVVNGSVDTGSSSSSSSSLVADAALSENTLSYVGLGAEGMSKDGLPQLLPSLPNSDTPLPNEVASPVLSEVPAANIAVSSSVSNGNTPLPAENASSESVSIGTAILNNLQRSSGLELASNEADRNVTSGAPTLSGLTQTMPERELSPLVTNFRANRGGSQFEPSDNIPASSEVESNTSTHNVQMDIHASAPYSPLLEGLRTNKLTHDSLTYDSREFSSPSTIYVPIAEASSPNSSDVLVAEALGAVDLETSTSDFIEGLAQSSVFSSVLGSEILLNAKANSESSELPPLSASIPEIAATITQPTPAQTAPVQTTPAQRIPLSPSSLSSSLRSPELSDGTITEDYVVGGLSLLAFDVSTKLSPAEQSVQRDKARRAKLTLSANQGSNRLQRITWL